MKSPSKVRSGFDNPGNNRADRYGMLSLLKQLIAAGCVLIYLYSLQFLHSGSVLRIAAVGMLIAGASLLTGCLLGFIFGIPRNTDSKQKADVTSGATHDETDPTGPNPVAPNSNLIEISDWLTKIMVGVGLVELNAIPHTLHRLSQFLGPALRIPCKGSSCADSALSSEAAAIAVVVFFFSIGFLFGYVWTRLYFEGDLTRAANQLWNKVVQLKIEKGVTNLALKADALRNEGHLSAALETVDSALKQDPSDALAVFTKARILKELGKRRGEPVDLARMNEALIYARKAAELMPGKAEPIYNIACYQALLGVDKREVLSGLAKAIKINPALRAIASDDPDLISLLQDPDFIKLTSPDLSD